MVYRKSERTRAAILDAASTEFAAHGLAGARVDRIARNAGFNVQALYYHVGNKQALFRAVFERGYATFRSERRAWSPADIPPAEGIERIVSDVFEFVRAAPEHLMIALDVNRGHGSALDADLRRRIRKAASPLLRDIETVLARGKAHGSFASDVDAEHLYFTIFALCSFHFTNAYTVSTVVGRNLLSSRALRERRRQICRFVSAAIAAG